MRSFFLFSIALFFTFVIDYGFVEAHEKRPDVSGEWVITIKFIYGVGHHTAIIHQKTDSLSGIYKGEFNEGTLRGTIQGEHIDFTGYLKHEASRLRFHYTGIIMDDQMEGLVDMGEYWSGTWVARRVKHD